MPPNLSNDLLFNWLVGYTDGDGCIFLNKKNKTIYIQYISCNPLLIQWIKEYFDKFGDKIVNKTSKVRYDKNYAKYSIGGLKAAQFINKVNNSGIYCLARKWQNPEILSVVEDYKQKYPNLFIIPQKESL